MNYITPAFHFEAPDFAPDFTVATRRGPVIITVPVPGDSLETIESKMEHISNIILRHGRLQSYRSPSTEALNRCNRSQDAAATARVEMTELEKISFDADWLNPAPPFPSSQIQTLPGPFEPDTAHWYGTLLPTIRSIWDFPTPTIYHAAWILEESSARFFVTAMAKYFAVHGPMEAENDWREPNEAKGDEIWLLLNVRECLRVSLAHERARAAELTQNIELFRDVVAARVGTFEP
jgi:hypothetical protein